MINYSITWAMPTMKFRNLGWRPASFLILLATGLLRVFSASVPSFKRGRTITDHSISYLADWRNLISRHNTFSLYRVLHYICVCQCLRRKKEGFEWLNGRVILKGKANAWAPVRNLKIAWPWMSLFLGREEKRIHNTLLGLSFVFPL